MHKCQDKYIWFWSMGVLRVFVNKLFYENFNIIFDGNI